MKINNNNGILTFLNYSDITDKIPVGNYTVMLNERTMEYYLTKKEDFIIPEKIYGDSNKLVDRYLNTFSEKKKTLGVLLAGEKGSGKTLLAQLLCKKANLPVLFIDSAYQGTEFNDFIGNITQEIIIFFDEFEKTYDKSGEQESLLGILDGNYSNKKLFIFTCNTTHVSSFMTNRPSRIYYKKLYEGLTLSEISEIIDSELINKANGKELIDMCIGIGKVNIDLVRSFIEEMNRYGETAAEVFKYLNITAEKSTYIVEIYSNKTQECINKRHHDINIKADEVTIGDWVLLDKSDPETSEKFISASFTFKDLKHIEEDTYKYIDPKDDTYHIIIKKKVYKNNLVF
jgi:adenylate kinase family enzyme